MMRIFLFCAAMLLLPAACFFFIIHQRVAPPFKSYKIELPPTWPRDPQLTSQSLAKLDREVADLIQVDAAGAGLQYPVVTFGKKGVELVYLGEQKMPASLEATLKAFIHRRIPELAREEQVQP